jgi:hypothetical protein
VQRKVQQAQALTVSHRVQEAAKTPRLPEQHLREFDYLIHLSNVSVSINSYAFRLGDYLLQRRSEEIILPTTIVSEFHLVSFGCAFVSFLV